MCKCKMLIRLAVLGIMIVCCLCLPVSAETDPEEAAVPVASAEAAEPETEPATKPTEPETQPATEPTEPETEPATEPTEPETEPATEPTEPETEPATEIETPSLQNIWGKVTSAMTQIISREKAIQKWHSAFLDWFSGSLFTCSFPRDTTPPVIAGISDKIIYQGDTISYRVGVTVTDDEDPNPRLVIRSDAVDLATPGKYTAEYIATDASGNEAVEYINVTVMEKKEEYLSIDEVWAKIDNILSQIIQEDMTAEEQCIAIYNWMRNGRFGYNRRSENSDLYQSAYALLKNGTGNCYNYFALSKLMFERLGIPNIDVCKVRNYECDSDHYWSLVSTDGGKTWYHFDVTPRLGNAPYFCLVTDAFLDRYSIAHGKSHNRDMSLYPATPES